MQISVARASIPIDINNDDDFMKKLNDIESSRISSQDLIDINNDDDFMKKLNDIESCRISSQDLNDNVLHNKAKNSVFRHKEGLKNTDLNLLIAKKSSVMSYAMCGEFAKNIAFPVGIATIIFITPGSLQMIFNKAVTRPSGFFNIAKTIALSSITFYKSLSYPNSAILPIQIIAGGMTCYGSVKLFNAMIIGPQCKNYASWRIGRMQAIMDNLTIPECYHDDEELSKYICPITCCPIRFPVSTKEDLKIIYEQGAIISLIQSSQNGIAKCPITRKKITMDNVDLRLDVYDIITARLKNLGYEDPEIE